MKPLLILSPLLLLASSRNAVEGKVTVTGILKKWHKITLTFDGPTIYPTSKSNHFRTTQNRNPFTDYRLAVSFVINDDDDNNNGTTTYVVPGYFACDGNAAESGATMISSSNSHIPYNKWRVHFAPDRIGTWNYTVSFREGRNIAVQDDDGTSTSLDGATGSFVVADTDKSGRDHRGKGRLKYVGERYLRFAETGEYFIKQGADSPENFLAYDGFDNTPNIGGRRKSWEAHVRDWREGDPTWKNGGGKGIIGALNYLSEKGMNAFSFLTMNIIGDDENVYPYIRNGNVSDYLDTDYLSFDCAKLDQWEIVFEHADKMGLYMHFKTQETENDHLLNSGTLGLERKLYYRELIARFSHHLALNWNLGEENRNTDEQRRQFASYIHHTDPYHHHIVIHNFNGQRVQNQIETFAGLLGPLHHLTGISLQTSSATFDDVVPSVKRWVTLSAESGKQWVVALDESGGPIGGIRPDDDPGDSHVLGRSQALWGNILAGGAGAEYFFGIRFHDSDLTCQDYRSRDTWWNYPRIALEFWRIHDVAFWEMEPLEDGVFSNNMYSLAMGRADGSEYVVYLGRGGTTYLDLTHRPGVVFSIRWYDPRRGGPLLESMVPVIFGGGRFLIGYAPWEIEQDWVVYVKEFPDYTHPPTPEPTPLICKSFTKHVCKENPHCYWGRRDGCLDSGLR